MKTIGKIFEYIITAAILFVALLVLSSVLPVPGGVKTYVVRSGSMEPTIKTGAVIVGRPAETYKVGDIITFTHGRETTPTTHRIVEVSNNQYFTKGDANEDPDGVAIRKSDIIGKVLFDIPYLGYAIAAAQKPIGFAALVILPALIIILDQVTKIVREVKSGRKAESTNIVRAESTAPRSVPVKVGTTAIKKPSIMFNTTKSTPAIRMRLRSTASGLRPIRTLVSKARKSAVKPREAYSNE